MTPLWVNNDSLMNCCFKAVKDVRNTFCNLCESFWLLQMKEMRIVGKVKGEGADSKERKRGDVSWPSEILPGDQKLDKTIVCVSGCDWGCKQEHIVKEFCWGKDIVKVGEGVNQTPVKKKCTWLSWMCTFSVLQILEVYFKNCTCR